MTSIPSKQVDQNNRENLPRIANQIENGSLSDVGIGQSNFNRISYEKYNGWPWSKTAQGPSQFSPVYQYMWRSDVSLRGPSRSASAKTFLREIPFSNPYTIDQLDNLPGLPLKDALDNSENIKGVIKVQTELGEILVKIYLRHWGGKKYILFSIPFGKGRLRLELDEEGRPKKLVQMGDWDNVYAALTAKMNLPTIAHALGTYDRQKVNANLTEVKRKLDDWKKKKDRNQKAADNSIPQNAILLQDKSVVDILRQDLLAIEALGYGEIDDINENPLLWDSFHLHISIDPSIPEPFATELTEIGNIKNEGDRRKRGLEFAVRLLKNHQTSPYIKRIYHTGESLYAPKYPPPSANRNIVATGNGGNIRPIESQTNAAYKPYDSGGNEIELVTINFGIVDKMSQAPLLDAETDRRRVIFFVNLPGDSEYGQFSSPLSNTTANSQGASTPQIQSGRHGKNHISAGVSYYDLMPAPSNVEVQYTQKVASSGKFYVSAGGAVGIAPATLGPSLHGVAEITLKLNDKLRLGVVAFAGYTIPEGPSAGGRIFVQGWDRVQVGMEGRYVVGVDEAGYAVEEQALIGVIGRAIIDW